jgi:predicted 3-demethylubiquinone-9 3-methyltransferase (glyoxalase superfamily)
MLNRAARDHVNHILIGVRSTQYRQNSSQMSSYQVYTDSQEETDRFWDAIVIHGGPGIAMQLVQG